MLGHKTANILNKVPKSVQTSMKADFREIHHAPIRTAADASIEVFAQKCGAKYASGRMNGQGSPGVTRLLRLPAKHWDHLRTSDPIESVFATVRHRTVRTRGALSPATARLMVFKLVMAATKTWRRLKAENQSTKLLAGVRFQDRTEVAEPT